MIGDGVKLDNQMQIASQRAHRRAHRDRRLQSGISGSTTIGAALHDRRQVGIAGHLTICDDVVVTGKSFVSSSIRKPGYYSSGLPVDETRAFPQECGALPPARRARARRCAGCAATLGDERARTTTRTDGE